MYWLLLSKKWGKAVTAYQILLGKIEKCYKNNPYKDKLSKQVMETVNFQQLVRQWLKLGFFSLL